MKKPRCNFDYGLAAPKPYKRKPDPRKTNRRPKAASGMLTRPNASELRVAAACDMPWRDAGTHPLLDTPAASVPPHECRRRVWSAVTFTGERVRCEWRS